MKDGWICPKIGLILQKNLEKGEPLPELWEKEAGGKECNE